MWSEIEQIVERGQQAYKALKYAPFPVVGAPAGMALGGGCEILLHCDAVQAHAETYMGLVEVGVGLIPGWGGCKEMLLRHTTDPKRPGGPMPPIATAFETDLHRQGRQVGGGGPRPRFLRAERRHHDEPRPPAGRRQGQGAGAGRSRLHAARAGGASPARRRPRGWPWILRSQGFRATGKATRARRGGGRRTRHGAVAAATPTSPPSWARTTCSRWSARHFLALLRTPGTLARIEHMLATGKPLRN